MPSERTDSRAPQRIESALDRIGRFVSWIWLALIGVIVLSVILRYAFGIGRIELEELQWHLYAIGFLTGIVACAAQDRHVRVDVLYGRLSRRGRAWIDAVGTVVFLIPFCVFCLWVSWPSVRNSWQVLEGSPDPGGLPRYPIKSVILLAFVLLILQGCAELYRRVKLLRGDDAGETAADGADRSGPKALA